MLDWTWSACLEARWRGNKRPHLARAAQWYADTTWIHPRLTGIVGSAGGKCRFKQRMQLVKTRGREAPVCLVMRRNRGWLSQGWELLRVRKMDAATGLSSDFSGAVLPEGWAACIDPTRDLEYYFDLVNNCAQWEFPEAAAALAGATSDAAAAPATDASPESAAAAASELSEFREVEHQKATHHGVAAEEQTPTAAEAAGAQAALGALLDADGEEELVRTAATAASYAKAFPAVAEALAAMGLAGLAKEAVKVAAPALEAPPLFEVRFPEPAVGLAPVDTPRPPKEWSSQPSTPAGQPEASRWEIDSSSQKIGRGAGRFTGQLEASGWNVDPREGAEQGGEQGSQGFEPLNWTKEAKAFSSAALLANMAGTLGGTDSLNGVRSLGAFVGQAPQSAPHSEAPPSTPAAPAAPTAPATKLQPAGQSQSMAPTPAPAATSAGTAGTPATAEAPTTAEAWPLELLPPSPLKAARAAKAAEAEHAHTRQRRSEMAPALHEKPRWDEAATRTATLCSMGERLTQTVPRALADSEVQPFAPLRKAGSGPGAAVCRSAVVQTEAAAPTEEVEEEHAAAMRQMKKQFVGVRRRCEALELRLGGEAGVMLSAFRRHQHHLQGLSRRHGALAEHARRGRAVLVVRALRSAQQGQLAVCWHTWRIFTAHARALHFEAPPPAPSLVTPAPLATPTPALAPAPVLASAPPMPSAMARMERHELYRMSYEALIDKVLELQETPRAGEGPAVSDNGAAATAEAALVVADSSPPSIPGTGGDGGAAVAVAAAAPVAASPAPTSPRSSAKGKKKK